MTLPDAAPSRAAMTIPELAREDPREAAVRLRALASSDPPRAAEVACGIAGAASKNDEILAEAAAVAIAHGGGTCPGLVALLGDDPCVPWLRCKAGRPLTGQETSLQDEPLCTPPEVAREIARELARDAEDVRSGAKGTRASLFGYAALATAGKVPASLTKAHDRRRYGLTQPREPSCESGLAVGASCHCEESVLRDAACRSPESSTVSVGLCRFEVDDAKRRLFNVVATIPP